MLARILLSASLLAPPPVAERSPWLHGMWTDGDGLLAVIELDAVRLSCRSGEERTLRGLRNLEDVAGAWVAGAPVIAALSEDGPLVRWRAEAWTRTLVPRVDESKQLAVAVDARGRVVVAGEKGAAYRLDGERWATLVYPTPMTAVGLAARADGSFVVVGAGGELAHAAPDAEQLDRILVLDMPQEPMAAWWGEGLWIAGRRELVRVDVARWRIDRRVKHDLFGSITLLSGFTAADGERVVVAAQSDFAAYDGKRLRRLATHVVFPEGLGFDRRAASLVVASRDGLTATREPELLVEPPMSLSPTCPLPGGQRTQHVDDLVARGSSPVPKDSVVAAASPVPRPPAASPVAPVKRRGGGALPTLRLGFGGAYAPRVPAIEGVSRTLSGFTLDLAAGVVAMPREHVFLWPELGYNLTVRDGQNGHFFVAGMAPLFGVQNAMIGPAARFVVGDAWGKTGVGVRSGVVGAFALGLLEIEGGHQWLRVGDRDVHDGRFMVSLNLTSAFALIGALVFFGGMARGFGRLLR